MVARVRSKALGDRGLDFPGTQQDTGSFGQPGKSASVEHELDAIELEAGEFRIQTTVHPGGIREVLNAI